MRWTTIWMTYCVIINRSTRQAQGQLAHHPLTGAYLEAGMRLLEEEFFAEPADEDDRPGPAPSPG